MNNSEIINEMVYKFHYLEKFIYQMQKFESELFNTLDGLKPTGLPSNFSKIPIHLDIRDLLTSLDFIPLSNLYDLKSQFELSDSTDHKPVILKKEIDIMRDIIKDFIIKSFVLKFHYEIYHYDAMRVWKDQKYEDGDTPHFSIPPTDHIRKISNCFINVIQQFDTPDMVKLSNQDQIYSQFYAFIVKKEGYGVNEGSKQKSEFLEMIQFWICVIGNNILQLLKSKISQIRILSPQGCNQLKTDLNHILNILCNFDLSESLLNYFSSVLFSLESKNNAKKFLKDKSDAYLNPQNPCKLSIYI